MHDRIDLSQICTSFANAACAATYWCYVGTPVIPGELRGIMTKKRRPPRIKKVRESSVGSLATNPHEGSRSEYLASTSFAIPVPHQEDISGRARLRRRFTCSNTPWCNWQRSRLIQPDRPEVLARTERISPRPTLWAAACSALRNSSLFSCIEAMAAPVATPNPTSEASES